VLDVKERRACSFERIYFSRGSDEKIYRERIALGHHLSKTVLEAINYDLKNTIFSYIPNTAEIAYYGLCKGMEDYLNKIKVQRILSWGDDVTEEKLSAMINRKIRQEKIAIKDVKASHIYYRRCEPKRNGAARVRYYLWYRSQREKTPWW
jgi:amidophosphoribosyltransferase